MYILKAMKGKWIVLCLTGLLSSLAFAELEVGNWYYEQSEYEQAYHQFGRAARNGDSLAQFNLGVMYIRGQFVEQDSAVGFAWLALAADNNASNDPEAVHHRLYAKFDEATQARADAELAELRQRYGQEAQKRMGRPTVLSPETHSNARSIRSVSAEFPASMGRKSVEGWVDVFYTIDKDGTTRDHSVFYSSEEGFNEIVLAALRAFYYEPATVNGKPVATYGMRQRYYFTNKAARTDPHRLKLFIREMRNKAENGNAADWFNYGFLLDSLPALFSDNTTIEFDDADQWLARAADEGHSTAAYLMGALALCYRGVSLETGVQRLLEAAEQDYDAARYILAMELLSGQRLEKSEDKGLYWLSLAAKRSAVARVRYAWILSTYPDESVRNADLALKLLDTVDKEHRDRQSYYQAYAAQAAEAQDFHSAVLWQKKAMEDAQRLGIPVDTVQARLTAYEADQPWREAP